MAHRGVEAALSGDEAGRAARDGRSFPGGTSRYGVTEPPLHLHSICHPSLCSFFPQVSCQREPWEREMDVQSINDDVFGIRFDVLHISVDGVHHQRRSSEPQR